MEINEWCERILFGASWEDKLCELDVYEDLSRKEITLPFFPGRPPGLGLDEWKKRERTSFREVGRFHSEKERGLVLHFFANHELLAVELMALAILKFQDAPAVFRRGVVQTLKDEQQHVRMYKKRMADIGIEFGQIPVSDYFWRALASMKSPKDFVTGLSMTLEQANLDYTLHYARIYEKIQDKKTAAILKKIYKDEIEHVKHGLIWFNKWRDKRSSPWTSYVEALPKPLTPARAKGIGFNREGRVKAGFNLKFIDELEVYSRSRGHYPQVYWFNGNCEEQITNSHPDQTPTATIKQLDRDLRTLPSLICKKDDIVLVEKKPCITFLKKFRRSGFTLPQYVEYGDANELNSWNAGTIDELRPWGWNSESTRFLEPLSKHTKHKRPIDWDQQWEKLYSKTWSAAQLEKFLNKNKETWLCDTEMVGTKCTNKDEVNKLIVKNTGNFIIKTPIASSGRGQIRVKNGQLRKDQIENLEKIIHKHKEVIVEPWLNKIIDLSFHFDINTNGETTTAGWTRFCTNARGQYRATFIHQMVAGLPPETKRFLYGGGKTPKQLHRLGEALSKEIGPAVAKLGYVGPVGIDALVYRDANQQLRLKPIVEINPRWTMGRVGHSLKTRVNSARTAIWLILHKREVVSAGFNNFAGWAEYIESNSPIELTKDERQISRGILFTTDPTQSTTFSTALVVAASLKECENIALQSGLKLRI